MKGTIRRRLTFSVVGATAVMLTLLVAGFNLALRSSLDADANRVIATRAAAVSDNVNPDTGRVNLGEGEEFDGEDGLVWIFAGGRQVKQPGDSDRLNGIASSLARAGEQGTAEDPSGQTRLYALPIERNDHKVGMVVVGASLEPYRETADRAAVASIVLAAVMLGLITVTTRLVVNRALRPVAEMTAEAANWSEHDLDQRFHPDQPGDELTRLAATFDTMLDRMSAMVRHERDFTAELSHELRTPLAAIAAEAEISLRRERPDHDYRTALARIQERSGELTRILETLLDAARSEGRAQPVEPIGLDTAIANAVSAAEAQAARYGVTIEAAGKNSGTGVRVGSETFQRMIGPLIENALAYARSRVTVATGPVAPGTVEVLVSDDGPGFTEEDLSIAFEPGGRGRASRNEEAPSGTGLGLALARRLARANGGDVEIEPSGAGATVRLRLPGHSNSPATGRSAPET